MLWDSEKRKLNYPLILSESPLGIGGDFDSPPSITPNWQTEDNEERVTITLTLSLDEFVAIASAIDVGRDIAFGEKSIELWHVWVRSLNTLSLCQQIADCIGDEESPTWVILQQIINNYLNENTDIPVYNPTIPSTPTYYLENPELIDLGEDCDLDQLFGAIREIMRVFNDSIMDLLQIVEAQTNTAELAQKVSEKIPFVGEYVESIPEWLDWLIEVFSENYAAAYTTELYDEMCCDLFCIAKPTCVLSFQTFADYFGSKVGASMSGDIVSIWDEIMSTAWAGENCVYAMHFLVCSVVAFGQEFLGLDSAFLSRIIQIGIGYPDNDWELLCEDCPDETCSMDSNFREDTNCWVIDLTFGYNTGVWYADEGFFAIPSNGDGSSGVAIYREFEAMDTPSIAFVVTQGASQGMAITVAWEGEGGTFDHNLEETDGIGDYNRSYNIPYNSVTKIWIKIYGGNDHEQYYAIRGATVTP